MRVQQIILALTMIASVGVTYGIARQGQLNRIPRGVRVNGRDVGGISLDAIGDHLAKVTSGRGSRTITVKVGDKQFQVTTDRIKLRHDVRGVVRELRERFGGSYSLWRRRILRKWARQGRYQFYTALKYDRDAINAFFNEMKESVERPPKNARLDLIGRKVLPSAQGVIMDLAGSIARFERILQSGGTEMNARLQTIKPKISSKALANLSLKQVLGWYETSFASWGKWANRAHNLKVGGARLTGSVILPGKDYSFNDALGPRSAKMGYRVAPIIALGELVDGMGGGMCQIASTLFAAAFFAGLDITHAKPHSQPSHYIDLGLDATVFYPSVDLVLRNPYNFPIAIRIDVSGGRVRVEILGQERPYDKVTFIRRIVSELPFKTVFREDKEMLLGTFKKDQTGQKGYTVRRRRIFMDKEGHEIKAHTWTIVYPPTTMIIKKGTKKPDDPLWKAPPLEPFKPKGDPPAYRRESQ